MLALFLYPQYARKEVNAMPYIPKDQIAAAREMDLLTYLRRFEPQELVHVGGNTYATRTHDSLKISNGKWCWWSRNIGFYEYTKTITYRRDTERAVSGRVGTDPKQHGNVRQEAAFI